MDASELLKRYQMGETTFKDISLNGGSLQGADLSNIHLNWVSFNGVNLEAANLSKAFLKEVTFKDVNLKKIKLKQADLAELDLRYQNLSGADLQEVKLAHAQLQEAILQGVNLQKADLTAANLRGADLRGAKLQGANIKETNLQDILNDETTIWKSVKNSKTAIFDKSLADKIGNEVEDSASEGENYIEVNGIQTSITFQEAKDKINQNIKSKLSIRQGQSKFRKDLLKAYNGRCAITGCDVEEALEAAHIVPYCLTKDNHISNGLLLRADLHTLFDLNLIIIFPSKKLVFLKQKLYSSSTYRAIHGNLYASVPDIPDCQPWINALQWRYDNYQDFLD